MKNEAVTEPNEIIQLTVQAYTGSSKSAILKLYQGTAKGRGSTTNYIKERWDEN